MYSRSIQQGLLVVTEDQVVGAKMRQGQDPKSDKDTDEKKNLKDDLSNQSPTLPSLTTSTEDHLLFGDGLSFSQPTGVGSTWEYLPDEMLEQYFTEAEINGLKNKYCGDVYDPKNPWQWQGQKSTTKFMMFSGPCCPNGHIYGFRFPKQNSTDVLRKVEVDGRGNRMPPFQIRSLIRALKEKKGKNKSEYKIVVQGDSTGRQAFFGFLCGFVRVNGRVVQCRSNDQTTHYGHPLCKADKSLPEHFSEATIVFDDDPTNTTYRIQLYHVDDFQQASIYENTTAPDVFLINYGLHLQNEGQLESWIAKAIDTLPPSFVNSLVWRGTTIQHFPFESGGSYEAGRGKWMNENINKTHLHVCADVKNEVLAGTALWREEVPKQWFSKFAPHVPVLSLKEMELHLYETYPPPFYTNGRPTFDCTHHIYTPMYYDSLFRRLAEILPSAP